MFFFCVFLHSIQIARKEERPHALRWVRTNQIYMASFHGNVLPLAMSSVGKALNARILNVCFEMLKQRILLSARLFFVSIFSSFSRAHRRGVLRLSTPIFVLAIRLGMSCQKNSINLILSVSHNFMFGIIDICMRWRWTRSDSKATKTKKKFKVEWPSKNSLSIRHWPLLTHQKKKNVIHGIMSRSNAFWCDFFRIASLFYFFAFRFRSYTLFG